MNYVKYFSSIKDQLTDAPFNVKRAFNEVVKYFDDNVVEVTVGEQGTKFIGSVENNNKIKDYLLANYDLFLDRGKKISTRYKLTREELDELASKVGVTLKSFRHFTNELGNDYSSK